MLLPVHNYLMNLIKNISQKKMRIISMSFIILISAVLFGNIVHEVFYETKIGDMEAINFDNKVLKKLQEVRSASLNQSMIDITALGSSSVIVLFTILIVTILVAHKNWNGLLYLFIILLGASILPEFLKNYFMRERPDILGRLTNVSSSSFPSGHSFGATVSYFSLAFLLSREVKNIKLEILYYFLAAIIVVMVGISRMYLGVHYPTDVIGGISSGLIWFSIVSIPFVYFSKTTDFQ
jgi:undecaprenyl-diphosphatase